MKETHRDIQHIYTIKETEFRSIFPMKGRIKDIKMIYPRAINVEPDPPHIWIKTEECGVENEEDLQVS